MNTYTERRKIREELQRSGVSGESIDGTVKCKCPDCGELHYKRKPDNQTNERKQER